MGGLQGGLLQGLLMVHSVLDALQVTLLGEVVFQAVAAAARGILTCSLGSRVDCLNIDEVIALQLSVTGNMFFQSPVGCDGDVMLSFLAAFLY